MGWKLTKGLENLRGQVNAAFPQRDKTSDGTIGDTAHQGHSSGHNPDDTPGSKPAWNGDPDSDPEVRAWDCDNDFGDPEVDAQDVVDHIRGLPNLSSVLRYMIYDRMEYHYSNGFRPEPYSGSNPHTEHIHFEGAWTQAADNNKTYDYRLEDLVAIDYDRIRAIVAEELRAWDEEDPNDPTKRRRVGGDIRTMEDRRGDMEARLTGQAQASEDRILSAIAATPPVA
jgi:hypothetical protein